MKKGYIYKIQTPQGKIYIGQTNNFVTRKRSYKNLKHKKQRYLWNDSLKYEYNPSDYMEIIEEILFENNELDNREIYWIKFYNSYTHENHNGLNLTKGGKSRNGYITSDETKEKLRQANLGKKQSEETKEKRKKQSIETWSDISLIELKRQQTKKLWEDGIFEHRKGMKFSEETKKKMSISGMGKIRTTESIKKGKISRDINKRIFEIFNIKEIIKGNRWGKGYAIKGDKIGEHTNIHDAAIFYKVSPISIGKCLRGQMLSAAGKYIFEYKYIKENL